MGYSIKPFEELRQIRRSLDLSQGEMGEALGGIKQATYSNYENGLRELPEGLLEKAKDLYLREIGFAWQPSILKDLVLGNKPKRESETARERHPEYTFSQAPIQGPTERDLWLADQVVENALRERDLFGQATGEQKRILAGHLARGLANGESLQSLQNGLKVAVDLLEATYRKEHE